MKRKKPSYKELQHFNTQVVGQLDYYKKEAQTLRDRLTESEKQREKDLFRQRYAALTSLADSVATLNRSLASVVGEAGALISK